MSGGFWRCESRTEAPVSWCVVRLSWSSLCLTPRGHLFEKRRRSYSLAHGSLHSTMKVTSNTTNYRLELEQPNAQCKYIIIQVWDKLNTFMNAFTDGFCCNLRPALEKLTAPREQSQHVRASLASLGSRGTGWTMAIASSHFQSLQASKSGIHRRSVHFRLNSIQFISIPLISETADVRP